MRKPSSRSIFSSRSTHDDYPFGTSDEQEDVKVLGPITVAESVMFNNLEPTTSTTTISHSAQSNSPLSITNVGSELPHKRNASHNKMVSLLPELYEDVSEDEEEINEEYNLSDSQKLQLQNLEIAQDDEENINKKKDLELYGHSIDRQTEKDFLLSQSIVSKKYFLLRRLGFPELDDDEERKHEQNWEMV